MLRIAAIDDEPLALENLERAIREAEPDAEVHTFSSPSELTEYVRLNQVDAAFMDIRIYAENGVDLAKKLKLIRPELNVVFTTGYSEYMADAFGMHASGYILKPVTMRKVRDELSHLRYQPEVPGTDGKRVRFRCFGSFEVLVDGQQMKFRREKARELLAVLVDRAGAMISLNEIEGVLWDDSADHASYLRDLRSDLLATLKEYRCADLLIRKRGMLGIDTSLCSCDYFDWKNGLPAGINAYHGEYMSQYSWGEFVNAMLYDEKNPR